MAARPNDALFAITEAAELAFAIGDVDLGLEYARDAASRLGAGDGQIFTPMQALLAATLGALANSLDIVWDGDSFARIVRPPDAFARTIGIADFTGRITFNAPSAAYNVALMQRVAAAQAASAFDRRLPLDPDVGPTLRFGVEAGDAEGFDPRRRRYVWNAFRLTPEGQAAIGERMPSYGTLARIVAGRELHFDAQLALGDATDVAGPHRGGFIDWGLLALWTGFFRTHPLRFAKYRAQTEGGSFIRALAAAIADLDAPEPEFLFEGSGAPG